MSYRFKSVDELGNLGTVRIDSWIDDYRIYLANRKVPNLFFAEVVKAQKRADTTIWLVMPNRRTKLLVDLKHITVDRRTGAISTRFQGLQRKELKIKFHKEDEFNIEYRIEE